MANNTQILSPVIARGTYEKFEEALNGGGVFKNLKRTLWGYLTGPEDVAGMMLWVDPSEKATEEDPFIIHIIKGNNPDYVQRVDELPDPSDAITNGLYIVGTSVYTFDGSSFYDVTVGLNDTIEGLSSRIAANEENITTIFSQLADHVVSLDELNVKITSVSESLTERIVNDETLIEALQVKDNELQSSIGANSALIESLGHDVDDNETAISNLSQTVSGMYTNQQIDQAIADAISESGHVTPEYVQNAIETYAYSKDETYTKNETDTQVVNIVANSISSDDGAIAEALANATYSKEEINNQIGDLGEYNSVAEAIQGTSGVTWI